MGAAKEVEMGGVTHYPYPKVWSPAGGWWCNPKNWQRNTKMCGIVIFPVALYIFGVSVAKEERPVAGRSMPYVSMFGRHENKPAIALRSTGAPGVGAAAH